MRHNPVPLRQAWRMAEDNDPTQAEQRDVPGGEAPPELQRSWASVLASDANQVGVSVVTAGVLYGAGKVAGKLRKPPPPPPPPPPPAGGEGEGKA